MIFLRSIIFLLITLSVQIMSKHENEVKKPVKLKELNLVMTDAMKKQQGMINSYTLMNTSIHVKITWSFSLSPDVLFTLRAKKMEFHFYNSCPNCCPENAVYAPNNYQGLRVFCANNVFDTVTAVDNNFFITFVSHLPSQGIEFYYSIRKKTRSCLNSNSNYRCFNNVGCYNINAICDDVYDCDDHSDEQNCMKCRPGYAACNNRNSTIIRGHDCFHPEKHRCDGILHCPSGEDELNCDPSCPGQLMCENKHGCYSLRQRCDNVYDCKDHSDEAHCNSVLCDVLENNTDYFRCNNSRCIPEKAFNNGKIDCDDGSDELAPINMGVLLVVIYVLLVASTIITGITWWSGMLLEFYDLRRHNRECIRQSNTGNVCTHDYQRKRKSEHVSEHDQEYKRKRIEEATIKQQTSFIYNYKVNPKRDASVQVSAPPSPKRYLKPNRLSNSTYKIVHSSNKNDISNDIKSQRTMTANSISSKQLESYSLKCVHQEVIVNPSTPKEIPELALAVNMMNSSTSKASNGTNTFVEGDLKTESSNIRLKTFEFWI